MTEATTSTRKTEAADKAKGIYDTYGVTASEVRSWAKANDIEVKDKGRLHPDVLAAFAASQEELAA